MPRARRLLLVLTLLVSLAPLGAAHAQNPAVTITVDTSLDRRPISPEIYGVAWATQSELADLNVSLNRWGGNPTSRYNWQQNADNRAADWYFESIGYASSTPGAEADAFVQASRGGGAEPMLTIPLLPWVARLGTNRAKLASFSIAKYGAQTDHDYWFPDAGSGIRTNGQYVTGNDPRDANVASDSAFQLGWMQHLTSRWGTALTGGLRYYLLDNEPSIWFESHRDVHPVGATMQEILDRAVDYAARVKDNDPGALVVGPEEWGWSGYILSGYDQQYGAQNGWSYYPDRAAHGGWDYLPWLLDQLRRHDAATGRRLLDVFSVHYYPQGGEFSDDVSSAMQLRRNRSTRSLWDSAYVDESWINDRVQLVPRLRSWVNAYYPGTRIALTEYNWGAEGHINGATAQADILGILGREGLDLAARWTTPDASTPTYKAIKLYRNYDGRKSTFGDTSVRASGPNPDTVASFAAVRSSDGALTVMVVSKALSGGTPVTVRLAGFTPGGAAQAWQLTAANAITRLSDVAVSSGSLGLTVPAQSITLLVVPATTTANRPPTAVATASPATGVAPLAVTLGGAASSDPDGTIVSYAWAFGDGATGSGVSVAHTYTAAGTYTATLTVTDNGGATASGSVTITVSPAPIVVAAPTKLTASVSSRTVTLRWTDNATNEGGFYVERAAQARRLSWKRVGTVGPNTTTFSERDAPGSYVYRVQAFDPARTTTSSYSNQVTVTVR